MTLDPDRRKELRRALGAFGTGVTVVTTGGPDPHAMTANTFTSVSLDPELVLVCIDRTAVMFRKLDTDAFGVSVLGADQEHLARYFADTSRPLGAAQFDGVDLISGALTSVPLLAGAVATFECLRWRCYDGGDHAIVLGRLVSFERDAGKQPLMFYGGRFRGLAPGTGHAVPDRRSTSHARDIG
jgi:flavin reductase